MLIMILAALLTAPVLVLLFAPLMQDGAAASPQTRKLAIGLMVILPLLALGLYLVLGEPDRPSAAALFEHDGPRAEQRAQIKAELALMRDLSTHPDDPQKLLALGVARLKTGRMMEALEALEQAHELAPDDIMISDRLGGTYYATGLMMIMGKSNTPDEVLEQFDKALAVAPVSAPYRERLIEQQKNFQDITAQMHKVRAQMQKDSE